MHRLIHRPFLLVAAVLVAGGAAAAVGLVASHHGGAMAQAATTPIPILAVTSIDPASGTQVSPDATLTVSFNRPLASGSPQPSLSPAVAGTWISDGPQVLEFQPSVSMPPGTAETLEIPGGTDGVMGSDGAHLLDSVSQSFSVAPMDMLRTQELLAELGYLPLTFTPEDPSTVPADQMAFDQAGTFSWKWTTMPGSFTSLWSEGQDNTITSGAVYAFESQMGLRTDGIAGPDVWNALLSAVASNQLNSNPNYDWVDVDTNIPESVTVWRNGAPIYSTVANTGIAAAPTQSGTWPVYARYTVTTMTGFNPNGTPYSDPGIPWVSYFHGGDALHGFIRASYGFPQSLGCVEMPISNAAVVFPLTPLGTLVTVEPVGAPANSNAPSGVAQA